MPLQHQHQHQQHRYLPSPHRRRLHHRTVGVPAPHLQSWHAASAVMLLLPFQPLVQVRVQMLRAWVLVLVLVLVLVQVQVQVRVRVRVQVQVWERVLLLQRLEVSVTMLEPALVVAGCFWRDGRVHGKQQNMLEAGTCDGERRNP
jgi:hypothetical protein